MDEQFKYWYAVKVEEQPMFGGKVHKHDVVVEGHIVYSESLLCGGERNKIMKTKDAQKEKNVSQRLPYAPLCLVCLELYKKHPLSVWYKWMKSVENTVPVG
jgi:hypothetical protein